MLVNILLLRIVQPDQRLDNAFLSELAKLFAFAPERRLILDPISKAMATPTGEMRDSIQYLNAS